MEHVLRRSWSAAIGTVLVAPVFAGTVIVLGPLAVAGWRVGAPLFGWAASRWIGAALVVAAAPIMADFLVRFVREGRGTPAPFAPPRHLVVRGAFRWVRNPGYLSAIAMIVGHGLLLGSAAVLVYAAGVALVLHLFVVAYEEPTLRRLFGRDYEAYCRAVPRWVPRVRMPIDATKGPR